MLAPIARSLPRLLLLLAAPLVLASATPTRDLALPTILGALLVVLLSLAPLVVELGPARPTRRAGIAAGGSLAVAALVAFTPPGALLIGSDLALGTLVIALAAGLLVASTTRN